MGFATRKRRKAGIYMNYEARRWAVGVPGLGAVGRSILLALAHSSDALGCSWSSQAAIAAHAQCAKRTVSRHLRILEARGLIRMIGRIGDHGGRTSCVYILVGWPGRELIPEAGHPVLGRAIRENALSMALHATLVQESHQGNDTVATQNKEDGIKDTTTNAEIERILDRCFEALGPWADDANRAYLAKDVSGLLQLIRCYDLEKHILPVLTEKSSHGLHPPPLWTWRYLQEPIHNRASAMVAAEAKNRRSVTSPKSAQTDATASAGNGETSDGGSGQGRAAPRATWWVGQRARVLPAGSAMRGAFARGHSSCRR